MIAFPSTTATTEHPALPSELITIHDKPPHRCRHMGIYCTVVWSLGRHWVEIQERPNLPPLAIEIERIERIERHKTLITPRVGVA